MIYHPSTHISVNPSTAKAPVAGHGAAGSRKFQERFYLLRSTKVLSPTYFPTSRNNNANCPANGYQSFLSLPELSDS